MPRKKLTKRTNKRQKISNIMVSVQKMEMDFIKTPFKMTAQLDKEIKTYQKQENKLTKALNKINNQVKKAQASIQSAAKAKTPAAGKKQLKIAKKIYKQASDIQATTNKQLQTVSKTLENLLTQQAKFTALGKSLNQFNTEWAKSLKKAKAKSKPQAVKKKVKIKVKVKNKSKSDNVEQINIQPVENTEFNSTVEEMTDLAS